MFKQPNQCDGCKQDLPLRGDVHLKGGVAWICCSKARYEDRELAKQIGKVYLDSV